MCWSVLEGGLVTDIQTQQRPVVPLGKRITQPLNIHNGAPVFNIDRYYRQSLRFSKLPMIGSA